MDKLGELCKLHYITWVESGPNPPRIDKAQTWDEMMIDSPTLKSRNELAMKAVVMRLLDE